MTETRILPKVAALGLAVWIQSAPGATKFAPEALVFVNNPPASAMAVDLDTDGDRDLLISGEAGLSVMFNLDGAGNFGARLRIGESETDLHQLVDLDRDGDLDILTVTQSSSRAIQWHRYDAAGYSAAIHIDSESALGLIATDLDGDGDSDLLYHDSRNDLIEWIEHLDGPEEFAAPQALPIGEPIDNIGNIRFVDLDGDGVVDLVGQDYMGTGLGSDDRIVWMKGSSLSRLGFGNIVPIPGVVGRGLSAHGDIDGDGDVDLIVSGNPVGNVQWLSNSLDDVLSDGFTVQPLATLSSSPENVSIVDLDGDGAADVLFSIRFEAARWCRNTDGDGGFANPEPVTPDPQATFDSLLASDFNGDGRTELVTTEALGMSISFQTDPGMTFATPMVIAAAVGAITDVTAADIDGEGQAEILFSSNDGKLQALPNLGSGQFGGEQTLLDGLVDLEVIIPLQLDGLLGIDVIGLRRDADLASWHAGDGTGNLGAAQIIDDFGFAPAAATAADFNGDGSLDVAVAFSDDDLCSWYSQDPITHAFTYHSLAGAISGTRAIACGDIDGDTDPDIVSAGFDGEIYVFTNSNGMGSFTPAVMVATAPSGTEQIELADLDGDGDLDILVKKSSGVASIVTALFNSGAGAFPVARDVFTTSSGVRTMAIGDLDQDGDIDFVTARGSVRWHENDGAGNFGDELLMAASTASVSAELALHDLDGDGDLDVLHATRNGGTVGWFRNDYRPPPPDDDPVTVWAWGMGVVEPDVLDLTSDGDGDGLTLLEEFAFNLDPLVMDWHVAAAGGDSGLPNLWFTFGSPYRSRGEFIRRRDRDAIGLVYTIETSPDMRTWSELAVNGASNVNADYQRATFNRSLGGRPPRHFTRIRLDYSPPSD